MWGGGGGERGRGGGEEAKPWLLLLLRRTLDGDACCPHEGGCPPQLLQVAIQLVPQKRRVRPCVPPYSII